MVVVEASVGLGKALGLKGKDKEPVDLPLMGKLGKGGRLLRVGEGVVSSGEPIKILFDCVDVTNT